MNKRMILRILGTLLFIEAGFMVFPALVALIYGEKIIFTYLICAAICAVCGLAMYSFKPKTKTIYARDGFAAVALSWVIMSFFGAIPLTASGEIPSFLDALFEMVSGFTTTGASILSDIDALSKASIFWRSFSHWIGGMGILVLMMAVLPLAGGGGNIHLMRAESPGPVVGKLVPKSKHTARILYGIYLAMTVLETVLLLIGGMPVFDSITLSLGTAGTGGFSISNAGFGIYSPYCQGVITAFMILFGVNFGLYYLLLCKKFKDAFLNSELHFYLGAILISVTVISLNIRDLFDTYFEAAHHAAFQIASLVSSTGYSTVDFDRWPNLSKMILLLLMCMGAMAGSTGGGFKVSRVLILFKTARREVRKLSHPRNVTVITIDGKRVSDDVIRSTCGYFVIYAFLMITSFIIVSIDSESDMVTTISSVIATLNNIGPGFGKVGAACNYGGCAPLSKVVYIINMLVGRLEIFPFFFIFSPSAKKFFQRRSNKI